MKIPILALCCVAVLATASAEFKRKQEQKEISGKLSDQGLTAEGQETAETINAGLQIPYLLQCHENMRTCVKVAS